MDSLSEEIAKGNFVRAAQLSASLDMPKEELHQIRRKALWRMSAINRNAPGTKKLAEQYWLSKEEVKGFLETLAKEQRKQGNEEGLESRYDLGTGRYLTFEEWLVVLIKDWKRLPALDTS
ncbi:MAG: hypothetical protein JRF30_10760 [Deltaproteobacteria bacterium]|nr:hypothetical protein [Deltaproteobacteria bacterium]MBW1794891.1 hypothetical protein [Deltaproteobacteria bacterium]MBW2331375.1 hypothetical protein [Deltaproteobacteria bacterium]